MSTGFEDLKTEARTFRIILRLDLLPRFTHFTFFFLQFTITATCIMTLEEVLVQECTEARVQSPGKALKDILVSAKAQNCLTVGVYESAKVMNVDPDSVAFCVLATDEGYEWDIALQIHFTLIQAFCFDNDINIVRVNDIQRLAEIVGSDESGEPQDAHCILVTNSADSSFEDPALEKLNLFCEKSRGSNEWLPAVSFPER
uniref:Growth arrest and DNA damage-inducible protein GADD45 gamma-like n=1 Tax=Lepisosteus oculatus TaxID=7918 RepID=W5MND6_LEPOC|nr:PREDICTED: growth arrest and DNA damage-inducible protein GADD45 gamma-like [Lepisosteus oculatus]